MTGLRLLYLSLSYVPSRRASSVHVMRMCQSFARLGHRVTLVTKESRYRQEAGIEDVFGFYGVDQNFEITSAFYPNFPAGSLFYLWQVRRLLKRRRPDLDLVYARDPSCAFLAAREGLPMVFEAHGIPSGRVSRRLFSRLFSSPNLKRLVVISEALGTILRRTGVVPLDLPILVQHDAAEPFVVQTTGGDQLPAALRKPATLHVGYVGHLYPGRGIEVIERLARALPHLDFHIVGGTETDIGRCREAGAAANLTFHGFVPPSRLSAFYEAFDVLLMPYQHQVIVAGGKTDTSDWMSPLKLFEYMATGKAIVSSDLPVLREVLRQEENALLVDPVDEKGWRDAIERLRLDPTLAQRLGETARRDLLERHTWDQRAEAVLEGISLEASR